MCGCTGEPCWDQEQWQGSLGAPLGPVVKTGQPFWACWQQPHSLGATQSMPAVAQPMTYAGPNNKVGGRYSPMSNKAHAC